jgi:hypothetical protein
MKLSSTMNYYMKHNLGSTCPEAQLGEKAGMPVAKTGAIMKKPA